MRPKFLIAMLQFLYNNNLKIAPYCTAISEKHRYLILLYCLLCPKVAGVKVYLRQNQNNRAHAVTACIGAVISRANHMHLLHGI
jgi:hypothetical protein